MSAGRSVGLSAFAIGSAVMGWVAFALAISLGDHFNRADPRSGVLLLLWALLGPVALVSWIAACVLATRARKVNRAEARLATTLAIITPLTWLVEFTLLIVWFGVEALSGPWLL